VLISFVNVAAEKGKKHDIVIVPIFWKHKEQQKEQALKAAKKIKDDLHKGGLDVWIDGRHKYTPGQKFAYWEHLGVVMRVEIGPEDLSKKTCTLRYSPEAGKVAENLGSFSYRGRCRDLLDQIGKSRKSQGLSEVKVPSDDENPNAEEEKEQEPDFNDPDETTDQQRRKKGNKSKKGLKVEDSQRIPVATKKTKKKTKKVVF